VPPQAASPAEGGPWAWRSILSGPPSAWFRKILRAGRGDVALRATQPLLTFNTRGFVALLAACVGLAASLGLAQLVLEQDRLAKRHAALVADKADEALRALHEDLSSLGMSARSTLGWCSPAVVKQLVHESLASTTVRRYGLALAPIDAPPAAADGSDALTPNLCDPLGPQRVGELPLAFLGAGQAMPGGGLSLRRTPDAELLVASLVLGHGLAGFAELEESAWRQRVFNDLRELSLQGQLRWQMDLVDAKGLSLVALDERHGMRTSRAGAAQLAALRLPLPHAQVALKSTEASLRLVADADSFAQALRQRALSAGLAGALIAALLGGLIWQRTIRRARLRHRIAQAVRKRQFEPFVQPTVDLASGRCVGGEVLMRWQHPHRGVIGPGVFIDEAERSGLIVPMTQLVMGKAAHRLARIAREDKGMSFSFNVTPADLRSSGFVQRLAATFHSGTLAREQVVLELTEREFVDDASSASLAALRAEGWRIAMDDFGTGHSSLALLERTRVDCIKIDRAFVASVDESTVVRPVLDAIVGLGHSLRVPLLAEGVETQAQREYLLAAGVQRAQGFLFARPMPLSVFERWLARERMGQTSALAPEAVASMGESAFITTQDETDRALLQALRSPGGVPVRDRHWYGRTWPACFVGREAVDWMVRERGFTRAESVRAGQRLLALGLVRHVADEHDFADAMLFYDFEAPAGTRADASGTPPAALTAALRGHGGRAPPWRTHRRGLVVHRRVCSARGLLDWIEQHQPQTPRATAVAWGQHWLREGVLTHVFDDRPFRDDRELFRAGT
jgi:EAL domain-containing protein (putative c-di-GMP-specific phosphodiesterase class I)